ncbi:MAG: MBL fold metallo-hydrolase [Deltaproteobacteria bacterium]|nr:MBL fold metallo-hydrolase [Deltaproteobacteria bacterium]
MTILTILAGCGPLVPPPSMHQPARTALLAAQDSSSENNPAFRIIHIDVGQGDASLLIAPDGETMLIDTGPPQTGAQAVLKIAKEMEITAINTILISHNHLDHNGSLAEILKDKVAAQAKIIDRDSAQIGEFLPLEGGVLKIIGVNGHIGEADFTPFVEDDENARSIALVLEYGDFRYFTGGDLTGGGGNPPYQTIDLETPLAPLIGDVDIMKVSHHGSHTSSNPAFLEILKPEAAIISAGAQNDFFHPHPSVVARYQKAGIELHQTKNGSICIVINGGTYEIKPYAIDKCAAPEIPDPMEEMP